MLLVATVLIFLFFGWQCTSWLLRGLECGPLERVTWASSIALAGWLGSLWILALSHFLSPAALITRTAVVAVVALVMWRRRPSERQHWRPSRAAMAAVIVIAAWSAFMLWRGAIIPPLSHDALSYHLPKAVLFARAGGFETLEMFDPRVRDIPVNYEMLLTEVVVLEGNDGLTEWLSVFLYLGFVVAAGALVERWWPQRTREAVAAVCVLAASVPVVLLHSGVHKNDVMTAFCVLAGFLAAGRWITTRERPALLLAIAMFAIAAGTKPHGAISALAIAPFLFWRWRESPRRWRELGLYVSFAVIAFPLLGGVAYLPQSSRGAISKSSEEAVSAPPAAAPGLPIVYGDWSNLWQAPYVLLAAPFSPSEMSLRVPWEKDPWFWRRHDMYISHAGIPFALCAIALPFAVARRRRDPGPAFERLAVTFACLATCIVMLPVVFQPHGFYAISLPRYLAFLYPVVFAWVVPSLMVAVTRRGSGLLLILALVSFVHYTIDSFLHDDFVPIDYILFAVEHPGTRVIAFEANRAASVVDRAAGPRERVAVEAAYGTWLQPAFGADLQRPVVFIRSQNGAPRIPDEADWVIVDRGYDAVWAHPEFKDLSQVRRYITRGKPPAEASFLVQSLLRDSRFEMVFYNPRKSQAVFRRVH